LAIAPAVRAAEQMLDVGIVQRFGEAPGDRLDLASSNGPLVLSFTAAGEAVALEASDVVLEIAPRPLPEPDLYERVVLGDYATFETAERRARAWQERGIAVEVAQPGRWQVWAERAVYSTPLLRQQLLESLRAAGYELPQLVSEVRTSAREVVLTVGDRRVAPSELRISAPEGLVRVREDNGETYAYAGTLRLQPDAYGTFALVNRVPLETYLQGVVPYEIAPQAPPRAIAAQAIVARTYALRNLRRFAADGYELCATVHCQVYRGATAAREVTNRAIAATSGLVLTYDSELIDALYSSTSGGVTAPFDDIWDGTPRPYLRARLDAPAPVWDLRRAPLADEATFRQFIDLRQNFNETGTPAFRWERASSLSDLAADLQQYLERTRHPLAGFTQLYDLTVVRRSPSGRVLQLDARTDLGTVELLKTEARSALGPPRSTLFYLEPQRDATGAIVGYTFIGGGFGHGVGMSQYGSYRLARLGWSPEQILAFYYPGTTLQPLDASVVFYDGD